MDSNIIVLNLKDKIPSNSFFTLQQKLKNVDNAKLEKVSILPLKNPIVGLIFGVVGPLFNIYGLDRFYKGNIVIGLIRLIIPLLTLFVTIVLMFEEQSESFMLPIFLHLITVTWWFIDLFLVWKGIKRDNLNRILMQL